MEKEESENHLSRFPMTENVLSITSYDIPVKNVLPGYKSGWIATVEPGPISLNEFSFWNSQRFTSYSLDGNHLKNRLVSLVSNYLKDRELCSRVKYRILPDGKIYLYV